MLDTPLSSSKSRPFKSHRSKSHRSRGRVLARVVGAAALGALVAGCNTTAHQPLQFEAVSDDYRARHQIRVAPSPVTLALDVHPGARGLTHDQVSSIHAFAADYRRNGRGPMVLAIPAGTANAVALHAAATATRATLAKAGVGHVDTAHVGTHPGSAGALALTYHAVGARVDGCGRWPADAAVTGNAANRSYHDFGCSSQRNLAAMVADPHDLVRPRAMGPQSGARRADVVRKHAAGEATTTKYDTSNRFTASDIGS